MRERETEREKREWMKESEMGDWKGEGWMDGWMDEKRWSCVGWMMGDGESSECPLTVRVSVCATAL